MKIRNFEALDISDLRRSALLIAEAGFEAIDTKSVLEKLIVCNGDRLEIGGEMFSLKDIDNVFVVGVGKCAAESGEALESILGDALTAGVVVDVKTSAILRKIVSLQGTHPMPSADNVRAAKKVVEFLKGKTERDLVVFAISGGGSTLLCLAEDENCAEEVSVMQTLMKKGAAITEVNVVRKHLSYARGGYLAKYAYPARAVSLIFSDVPGDNIEFVASGPTVRDTTTIEEAENILAKYDVLRTCGIERCGLIETPKEEKYFENVKNMIVVSNQIALQAMKAKAETLGFRAEICNNCLTGEASLVGKNTVEALRNAPPNSALLFGGETTVTIRGAGRGGRNLELALAALENISDGELILPIASDGRDNGEFAGAICDIITREAVRAQGFHAEKFLSENNEYPLFEEIGQYLLTGHTGSNVSDLLIALKK